MLKVTQASEKESICVIDLLFNSKTTTALAMARSQ